jgi:hypothetical protein
MKYISFFIDAVNKHSKGEKVSRPIMFELHDITEDGFTFRFRDIKLKHCTCSIKVNTLFNILDEEGELSPVLVAEFLSKFFKHYYTYAQHERGRDVEEYGLSEYISLGVDKAAMRALQIQLDDNSISPTVIKGIIETLEEYVHGSLSINTEAGEKTKSVQKNRKVIDFEYDYAPLEAESSISK